MQKPLTSINLETLRLLAHGRNCKQVAAEMRVGHRAVNERVIKIKKALNCKTITQAVYITTKSGLL